MAKKIEIGEYGEIKVVWNTTVLENSEEKENCIKESFSKKYGIPVSKIKVEKSIIKEDGETQSLNKEAIQDIQDPKFQQALFKQYLDNKEIKDYDFDEIIKIDNQINSLIDYDSYEKGKKYAIKWLDWSNFLSYGKINHIDFTNFKGLTLLESIPANQGGKSTFAYDLLHFLFFGKTSSGKMKTLGDLFNDNLPEETVLRVEGCLNIDGEDYVIRRVLTRPKKSSKSKTRTVTQKVEYFKLREDGSEELLADSNENLREENNIKTSKAIIEAIGNERDFDMVISANADNLKDLISLKETDRGRLLSRWIGLMPLEDKDVKAREKWNKEVSQNRYSNKYNRESLKNEIEAYENQISENKKEIEKNNDTINGQEVKIERLNNERNALLQAKKKIDDSLLKVDVHTLETAIERITNDGILIKRNKEIEESKLVNIGELEVFDNERYSSLQREKDSLVSSIANIKANISILKNTNEKLEKSECCPVCGKKFDNVDNTEQISKNTKEIEDFIARGVSEDNRRKEILSEIEKLDVLREKHIEKNKIELQISKYTVELSRLREALVEKRNLKKSIEDNKASIQENNALDCSINVINENLKVESEILERAKNVVISSTKDIEIYSNSIKERKFIIQKITEEEKIEKNWKLYLMLVGKDGISKMVLRNALPIINTELKRLLDDVCDFDVEVQMNDDNDVDFKMISKKTGVVRRLAAGSGLEQTAASLALRVVLGSMSALSKPPFLLLDEVLGGVAGENYDNLKRLYDKIAQYYTFVFQICHVPLDWYENTVTIIKNEKGISSITTK